MMSAGVRGVRFIAMNTDGQALSLSTAPTRICLGQHYTRGLGAGGNAAIGKRAATESAAEIRAALGEPDLVFIAAGMGGGTGTGAAPVVASIAKKLGALTIGIVTYPFAFEGSRRRRFAEEGLAELSAEIDALITVPNDRLLSLSSREHSLNAAFKLADDVLRQGVQGIAEVINVPGMVNVDFADVRSVLFEAGTALMSIGQGSGRNRAQRAAEEAIAGGFLNVSIRGASRVLFNISGGEDMTLFEVNEIAERIGEAIDGTADIIFGAVIDPSLHDTMRVTLIAAGMEENHTVRLQAVRPEQVRQAQQFAGSNSGPQAMPSAPSRPAPMPASSYHEPVADASATPAPPRPSARPAPAQPPAPPFRPSGPPERQKRSLDDLRGIRGMGRRQEALRGNLPDDDYEGEAVDVPPFIKRRNT
jgi:cell division protein FtsZ